MCYPAVRSTSGYLYLIRNGFCTLGGLAWVKPVEYTAHERAVYRQIPLFNISGLDGMRTKTNETSTRIRS